MQGCVTIKLHLQKQAFHEFKLFHGIVASASVCLTSLQKLKLTEFSCKAGDAGDASSVPEWGRSRGGGEGMVTDSSILARKIPWTEEPGRLQSMGHKDLDKIKATEQHSSKRTQATRAQHKF